MSSSLSEQIKQQAKVLGFHKIGIARPDGYSESAVRLDTWLKRGYHAEMQWMEKRQAERSDITGYFPDVRSIIVVGMNYYTGLSADVMNSKYKISNYAWGTDYHLLVKSRLKALLTYITGQVESAEGICCVDTSPVMEKFWATRAGLGWQGKHTNLISNDYGSWLFLGEILLNIDLEYDPSFDTDHCGTCTACIDACPTNALEPYLLDSNKCISYLTIEKRGEIAGELADRMGDWIYGCDICQEICPWNRKFARKTKDVEFIARNAIAGKSGDDWENLTKDEFINLFSKSAIKRTKHHGLERNIKIAASKQ